MDAEMTMAMLMIVVLRMLLLNTMGMMTKMFMMVLMVSCW